jgi:hypothetical protein
MPPLPEFDAKVEQKFRVSYTHGVTSVLAAVTPVLSAAQVIKLKRWATNELLEWRVHAADGFEEAPRPPKL